MELEARHSGGHLCPTQPCSDGGNTVAAVAVAVANSNSDDAAEAGGGSDGDFGGSGGGSLDSSALDCTEDSGSGSCDNADSSDRDEGSGYVSPAAMQINSSQWLRADSGYVSPDEDE